jgi:hypothetical protein
MDEERRQKEEEALSEAAKPVREEAAACFEDNMVEPEQDENGNIFLDGTETVNDSEQWDEEVLQENNVVKTLEMPVLKIKGLRYHLSPNCKSWANAASFSTRSSGSNITSVAPSRQRRLRRYRSRPSGKTDKRSAATEGRQA